MSARRRVDASPKKDLDESDSKSRNHGYEFGGPIGVMAQMMTVPFLVIAIVKSYETTGCEFKKVSNIACNSDTACTNFLTKRCNSSDWMTLAWIQMIITIPMP